MGRLKVEGRRPLRLERSLKSGGVHRKAKVSNVWLASFPSKILWLSLIFKEKSDGGKRERIGWQTMSSRDSNAAISLHAFLNILRCWKQASFVRCEQHHRHHHDRAVEVRCEGFEQQGVGKTFRASPTRTESGCLGRPRSVVGPAHRHRHRGTDPGRKKPKFDNWRISKIW